MQTLMKKVMFFLLLLSGCVACASAPLREVISADKHLRFNLSYSFRQTDKDSQAFTSFTNGRYQLKINTYHHCCLIDFETIKAAEKQQVAFQEV